MRITSTMTHTTGATSRAFPKALGLGVVAGLRSMLAPALLSRSASRGELRGIEETPFAALASPRAAQILTLLAIGEAIADKTPVIPSRASMPVLIQRAATGAAVGGALYAARRLDGRVGASLGAVAAIAGALSGQGFRQLAAARAETPSLLPAFLEDAFAVGLGLLSLRGRGRR